LVSGLTALSDEFGELSDSFGGVVTLVGLRHGNTTNPDGTGINFWTPDYEGADATSASLSNPHMSAADAYGNVYIADKASNAILKIAPDGSIHTFAGTHEAGFNGDGPGLATELQIASPNGLFVLPDGTVYLLDPGNHRIRRVGVDGVMATIVNDPDSGWAPSGRALWVSPDETLIYYTHEYPAAPPSVIAAGATVKMWTPAGGIETVCSKAVGFRNPGNIAVNPVDGKLYVTDRAEEDSAKLATGLFRIDGPDQRTRVTGNVTQPKAAPGQLAINSFIEGVRGIAFLPNGSYFLCAHKGGDVWFVDTDGVLHRYIQGSGKGDAYLISTGQHPPLVGKSYVSQPRAVSLAPNGDLLVTCNDSGYVLRVQNTAPPSIAEGLRLRYEAGAVHVEWTGVFGRGYRLERCVDLRTGLWTPIGAMGGQGPASVVGILDKPALYPHHAYYRVLPAL
ncbi:MAG: hypothetical protein HYR88_07870, partial [Verrucomicrobia bacterium]|nr:hypothetical protein [Verrucomicrobiota bacterium]